MGNVTLKINNDAKERIIKDYTFCQKENPNEYVIFFAKHEEITISIFKNNKYNNVFKAVFTGNLADKVAAQYSNEIPLNLVEKSPKKSTNLKEADHWIYITNQIGSDEVGTGDFFGPICVCATYVEKKDIKKLKELGVDDSKKLTDEQILKIGKELIKFIDYSQVSVSNEKYNELYKKGLNINSIKAKLHNTVLLNLSKRHPETTKIFVDQFVSETTYYKYLKDDAEIQKKITFRTKGESAYPSVACGSIIARYSFLKKMEQLNKKLNKNVPFGAGTIVDNFAKKLYKEIGRDEFDKLVKKNFANYNKL